MRLLGLVKLQGSRKGLQDALGDAAQIATLQPGVVLGAHPSKLRDFAAAQPRHPPFAVRLHPGLIRSDLGTTRLEEGADFRPVVHQPSVSTAHAH